MPPSRFRDDLPPGSGSPETASFDPRFTKLSLIGEGSMGVVYKAYDAERGQDVALKTLRGVDPHQVFWLKSEFRALADVRHPNLVELQELRMTKETCFFTMELIDGTDFVSFVGELLRADDVEPARLPVAVIGEMIAQLVRGIQAIHNAGKLHRDIKPSNVLVTRDRRVVLLDFGLVLPVKQATDPAVRGVLSGTPLYMSPEQICGDPVSERSDWYSLGVVLFEALTGEPPFQGSVADLIVAKGRGAPDLRARTPRVPGWLAALVSSLLEPDPERRPGGPEILTALRSSGDDAPAASGRERFVGRAGPLAELGELFSSRRSAPFVVHVRGESGIGKTALIEQFVDRLERQHAALVLRGRCHPRESLPFKALDGVIDSLTQTLLRDPRGKDVLHGAGIHALTRLFPVLARVDASIEPVEEAPVDPIGARRAGAEALARVLDAIAGATPLVLWIDDLQWGDTDSAAVLRSVLSVSTAPGLLVILSYRSDDVTRSPLLRELSAAPLEAQRGARQTLDIEPLSAAEATELARAFLSDAGSGLVAGDVARESRGSPFFIRELARHGRSHAAPGGATGIAVDVDALLTRRLDDLAAGPRRVLELVSLAATTLSLRATVDASGVGGDAYSSLRLLEGEGFVRLSPLDADQGVEPYHDRIRESVVTRIDAGELPEHHRTLARVLQRGAEPDPEALLAHHLGAGEVLEALRDARAAARRAAAALAFDRAAALYETALGLVTDRAERFALVVSLAETLDSGGRTGEAADRFLEATRAAEEIAVEGAELRTLRRRTSECLLRSGRSAEGRAMLWSVLRSVGAPLPRSERDALRRATLARLPLLLGRVATPRSRARPLSPAARERLDTLWAAAICLSWEPVTASFFRARYIREALPTNEPLLVAAALGAEAASQGALRWGFLRRRGDRLVERMEELAGGLDDPYTSAHAASVRAHNAFFCGRWREALEHADREIGLLQRCHGVSWELAVGHIFALLALSFLGDMPTLKSRLEAALRDAEERGDRFAIGNLHLGQHNFYRLAADECADALQQAAAVRRSMPDDRFEVQHYHHVVLVTQCHLYRQDPLAAWNCIHESWPRLKAAQFLQLEFTRIELLHLRARAAVALAAGARERRAAPGQRDLLRIARRATRAIRRSRALPAQPFAAAIEAAIALQEGDRLAGRRALEGAVSGFERADMALHAEGARLCLGSLVGGDAGDALRRRAVGSLLGATARPEAIAATLLPGVIAS